MLLPFLPLIDSAPAAQFGPSSQRLKGGIGIVQGTLANSPTVNNFPQTVQIQVSPSTTNTYNNVYLVTDPFQNSIGQGAQVMLVLQGSTPLIANFTQTSIVVGEIEALSPARSLRTIPMSSSGQLQAGILINLKDNHDGLAWTWPPFMLNSYNFINGATGAWSGFPSLFNLTLPTTASPTQQTMSFIASNPKPYGFHFSATGANANLVMDGAGYTNPLTVSGTMTGSNNVFTRAALNITSGP